MASSAVEYFVCERDGGQVRMGLRTGALVRSTGALQPLRDAGNAGEQSLEEVPVAATGLAPAMQQIDLHEVHGVDIRVAQLDGALQGRVGIQQGARVLDREDMLPRDLEFGANLPEEVSQRLRSEDLVILSDIQIGARQHRLDVIEQIPQEEPICVGFTQAGQ